MVGIAKALGAAVILAVVPDRLEAQSCPDGEETCITECIADSGIPARCRSICRTACHANRGPGNEKLQTRSLKRPSSEKKEESNNTRKDR